MIEVIPLPVMDDGPGMDASDLKYEINGVRGDSLPRKVY
jgi:hypothetical protein